MATIAGKGRVVEALELPMFIVTAASCTFASASMQLLRADWLSKGKGPKSKTRDEAKRWDVLGKVGDDDVVAAAGKGEMSIILDFKPLAAENAAQLCRK